MHLYNGEENRGFGVLLQRLKFGRRTTEALLSFLGTRIEIEEEYNKRLQKLGNFVFPKEQLFLGGTKGVSGNNNVLAHDIVGALLALQQQTVELCKEHSILIDSLKQRLLWPLEHSLKEQSSVKDQHKQEMLRIVKSKISQEETVKRLKERYYTRCKEKTILIDDNVVSLAGKALEKHEQKLKRAKEAEQQADAEYRSNTYKLAELHSQWESRMGISTQEFQKLEGTRLALTKHVLEEYSAINQCHMQEQIISYERLRDRAQQCDHQLELQGFVSTYGTGTNIPRSPPYIHFNNETIEDSLRRLSIRATQSPRKLYSSDQTDGLSAAGVFGGLVTSSSSYSDAQCVPLDRTTLSIPGSRKSSLSSNSSISVHNPRGSIASITSNSSFSPRNGPLKTPFLYKVRALYTYGAQQSDEISLKEGQIVKVISIEDDPWWYGQIDTSPPSIGLFPSNYVERM